GPVCRRHRCWLARVQTPVPVVVDVEREALQRTLTGCVDAVVVRVLELRAGYRGRLPVAEVGAALGVVRPERQVVLAAGREGAGPAALADLADGHGAAPEAADLAEC